MCEEGPNLPAVHPQRARAVRHLSWGPHAFHGVSGQDPLVWGASVPIHPNPCRPRTNGKGRNRLRLLLVPVNPSSSSTLWACPRDSSTA